jgi:hypothetical protein
LCDVRGINGRESPLSGQIQQEKHQAAFSRSLPKGDGGSSKRLIGAVKQKEDEPSPLDGRHKAGA